MAKSYWEKLKDPRWQKKRLETLEDAGWACENCGTETDTLAVHHRWYLRGKEPWEYERNQLEVLCDACHKSGEKTKGALTLVLSEISSCSLPSILGLVAGRRLRQGEDVGCPLLDYEMAEAIASESGIKGVVAEDVINRFDGEDSMTSEVYIPWWYDMKDKKNGS